MGIQMGIDVDCSADLKHCVVEWFFRSRDIRKEGGRDESNFFLFNALFFT
jgi:hypothetical protein